MTTATTTTEIVNEAVPAEWKETPLRMADRCDKGKCAAQAFVRTFHRIENGEIGELTWCKHHYEANETAMKDTVLHVQDERHLINAAPSPSANKE